MRIVEVAILGLAGMAFALSSDVSPPEGERLNAFASDESALTRLHVSGELPGGTVQQTAPMADLLRAARTAEPLVCALMLRSFDFGFWSGGRGARVHVPGDPASSVREAFDRLTKDRPDADAAPALIQALSSDSDCEQRLAAAILGRIKDQGVRAQVRRQIDAGAPRARLGAVLVAGYADDHEAVPALERALSSQDSDQKLAALWAMGRIEGTAALAAIERAVSDPDARVRQNALWALGRIESSQSVSTAMRALTDTEVNVRINAAWALGRIESSEAIPALVDRLAVDQDAAVRRMIAWALGQIE